MGGNEAIESEIVEPNATTLMCNKAGSHPRGNRTV